MSTHQKVVLARRPVGTLCPSFCSHCVALCGTWRWCTSGQIYFNSDSNGFKTSCVSMRIGKFRLWRLRGRSLWEALWMCQQKKRFFLKNILNILKLGLFFFHVRMKVPFMMQCECVRHRENKKERGILCDCEPLLKEKAKKAKKESDSLRGKRDRQPSSVSKSVLPYNREFTLPLSKHWGESF